MAVYPLWFPAPLSIKCQIQLQNIHSWHPKYQHLWTFGMIFYQFPQYLDLSDRQFPGLGNSLDLKEGRLRADMRIETAS